MGLVPPARCRLVEQLGAGSICQVALVDHAGERLICKRLRPRMRSEPRAQAASARECEALRRFAGANEHSVLPRLAATGDDEHGPWWLQTVAPGHSLAALMARGPIPPPLLAAMCRRALLALAELHGDRAQPVHGDLTPEHVFITPDPPAVTFIDLGMARWKGQAGHPGERGTLPYLAPEVASGAPPDQAADAFALLAVFAHAVLGRAPVAATHAAARLTEIAERGLDLAALPHDHPLTPALRAGLAPERDNRQVDLPTLIASIGS